MENLIIQNTMCQNVIFCLIYKFLCNLNDNLVYLIWNTFLYNSQVRKYGEILPYSEANSLASLKRLFNGPLQKAKDCWVGDKRLFLLKAEQAVRALYPTNACSPYLLPTKPHGGWGAGGYRWMLNTQGVYVTTGESRSRKAQSFLRKLQANWPNLFIRGRHYYTGSKKICPLLSRETISVF